MYPILFEFPGFTFYTQTLFFIMAFIAGLLVVVHEGKYWHISRLDLTDIVFMGIFGRHPRRARLFLVMNHGNFLSRSVSFAHLARLMADFLFTAD
jgi:hypothetical protein